MPHYWGHLICSSTGYMKLTKSKATRSNEVAVKVEFDLPSALFEKPVLMMRSVIDQTVTQIVVTPELRAKAQEILEKELGIRVELVVPEQKQEEQLPPQAAQVVA